MLTFKKRQRTENCIREILPLPASLPFFNQLCLLATLTFKHLLRDKTCLWRTQGPNVLSFWGNSCKTMWWANTFWYIEVLLTRRAWKWIPPLWVSFFFLMLLEAVIGNLGCRPWLFILSSLHMTMLLAWQTKQGRNYSGALPTAKTINEWLCKL